MQMAYSAKNSHPLAAEKIIKYKNWVKSKVYFIKPMKKPNLQLGQHSRCEIYISSSLVNVNQVLRR
jgi:hypothetical protein